MSGPDPRHPSMSWQPPTSLEMALVELARVDADRDHLRARLTVSEELIAEQVRLIHDYRAELAAARQQILAHELGEDKVLDMLAALDGEFPT